MKIRKSLDDDRSPAESLSSLVVLVESSLFSHQITNSYILQSPAVHVLCTHEISSQLKCKAWNVPLIGSSISDDVDMFVAVSLNECLKQTQKYGIFFSVMVYSSWPQCCPLVILIKQQKGDRDTATNRICSSYWLRTWSTEWFPHLIWNDR